MTVRFNRRTFNTLLGSTLGAGLAAGTLPRRAAAAGEITVLNWKGYGTDEAFALEAFTAATGIAVRHDYFNSEPEMLTKLRTNPGAYDVVLVNSARTAQAQAEGLIEAIDYAAVPNAADVPDAIRSHANLYLDGTPYGVPWLWGMSSLTVREGVVEGADSWAIMTDPAYEGRLCLFDDSVTAVAIGALLTGQDINDPQDLAAIGEVLKSMKPNLKLLWSSEDEWNRAFAAGSFDISVYWSGAAVRAIQEFDLPVEFVVPKEGAIGWLDILAVPVSSTAKDEALAFIDYMIDPDFYVTWATTAGAPASANAIAMEGLPPGDLNAEVHKAEYFSELQMMADLPDDRRQAFVDLWEEVKAHYAA
ncbi:MAG: PotD/PotF family extracellular solute-binding protein [Alphaproteobacteria bacterium]